MLEKDQAKSHLVFFGELFDRSLLQFLYVQVQVLVWLQDVRGRTQYVIQELSEEESSSLVLLARLIKLSLQVLVVVVEGVVLLLLHDHVLLLLLQLLLQEVDQVLVALRQVVQTLRLVVVGTAVSETCPVASHACWEVDLLATSLGEGGILALSKLVVLSLEALDDFLAEVGPLGQLFLDFLVDLDLALVSLNLLLHLVILEDEDLGLLRLVLQLGRQLVVLQDRQVRRCLQLLVVHSQEVGLRLLDVEEHLFAELFGLLDPV